MATTEEFDADQWLGDPTRTTTGSNDDEFILLGNRRQGPTNDGNVITSYSAIRVSDNKPCRVAFPSIKLLDQFKKLCKKDIDTKTKKVKGVRVKVNYDLEERKGSFWVNKVFPFE